MLVLKIIMLNKCNIYWIVNKSLKKTFWGYSLFIYFVVLFVGLKGGLQPETNTVLGVITGKSLGAPVIDQQSCRRKATISVQAL